MSTPSRSVRKIIQKALQKLGIYASGETIPAEDMNDGLISFQDMMAEWAGDGMLVPAMLQESFSLVPGQTLYTIGEDGADFDTQRPDDIIRAFIREGDLDYPVSIIDDRAYSRISDKSNGGSRPEYLRYNPTAPNGTINIYRSPSSAYSLFLISLKAIPEGAGLTDDIFFDIGIPRLYNNAIIYSLAVELAPEYGIGVNDLSVIAAKAESGKNKIRSMAAANRVRPAFCEFARSSSCNSDLVRFD